MRPSSRGSSLPAPTYIQIDEPSPAIHPEASDEFAALFNEAAAGVQGRVALAAHLCFGNFYGRPLSRRLYRPVLEQALAFEVSEFVLEYANREMAELDVAADITAAGRHLSAGVIDVKNYYLETADDVAWRIDRLLEAGVPEAQLSIVPDCGFSQTARWAVKPKLAAMVAGRDLVRGPGVAPPMTKGRPLQDRPLPSCAARLEGREGWRSEVRVATRRPG